MTRTVKLDVDGEIQVSLLQGDVFMRLVNDKAGTTSHAWLTPRDLTRLIAALSRTQAARKDRKGK